MCIRYTEIKGTWSQCQDFDHNADIITKHQDDSTRFLEEWTILSTTNGDAIQPSRELLLEVSDINFSSFILV
jgi:hypothetical protein